MHVNYIPACWESAPWKVTSVTLDIPAKQLIVNIELEPGIKWIHPETKQPANIHKWTERTWRDLDSVSFATIIKAKVQSIKYADGKFEEVAVSWAERYQRSPRQFEQQVIMWLKDCGNVSKVANCLNLHLQTVDRIMKRAVERGLMKRDHQIIRHIGIDEFRTDSFLRKRQGAQRLSSNILTDKIDFYAILIRELRECSKKEHGG